MLCCSTYTAGYNPSKLFLIEAAMAWHSKVAVGSHTARNISRLAQCFSLTSSVLLSRIASCATWIAFSCMSTGMCDILTTVLANDMLLHRLLYNPHRPRNGPAVVPQTRQRPQKHFQFELMGSLSLVVWAQMFSQETYASKRRSYEKVNMDKYYQSPTRGDAAPDPEGVRNGHCRSVMRENAPCNPTLMGQLSFY